MSSSTRSGLGCIHLIPNPSGILCGICRTTSEQLESRLDDISHHHWKPLFPENARLDEKLSNWLEFCVERSEQLEKKLDFLETLCSQFRKESPPDIHLKPGDNQHCFPAHVTMLATRSEVLKNMVGEEYGLKLAATRETVLTFSELKGEVLESLLEFLYSGSLSKEIMDKHVCSLLIAANKYDIPYLLRVCETDVVESITSGNNMLDDQLESVVEFINNCGLTKEMMDKHAYRLLIAANRYNIPKLFQVCETHIVKSVIPSNMHDDLLLAEKCLRFLRCFTKDPLLISDYMPDSFVKLLMETLTSRFCSKTYI